ncbi:uncharacterized protein [Misgurnus anguillicaudatus]|uniref:uncharacterized protein n=1 Tax=Misgurnus anguillicaudatus TaxID=75329 RepID=UPI003CCF5689
MNLVFVSRYLCFRGVTVLLMFYSCCDCNTIINITATSGDPAVLPCSCPSAHPPFFVWQKVVGRDEEVVNCYSNDAKESQTKYQNRTQVVIQTENCSLVFNSVSLSDEGLYKCYYQTQPLRHEEIYLKVTASMECKQSNGQYHCQLPELHPEEKILWRLDGQLLPLSVQCTKDAKTGLCDTSDSITLNGTNIQKLTCEVTKSNGNNKVICTQDSGPVTDSTLMTSSVCGFLTVLLVIAAVFVGIMCRRRKSERIATSGRNI